jgi:hypothetical protein
MKVGMAPKRGTRAASTGCGLLLASFMAYSRSPAPSCTRRDAASRTVGIGEVRRLAGLNLALDLARGCQRHRLCQPWLTRRDAREEAPGTHDRVSKRGYHFGLSWVLMKPRRLTLTMHELIAWCAELTFKTDEIRQFD